jgi:cytoskeletal protein CcmA (bactofilin family)
MFRRKSRTPIDIARLSSLIAAGVEIVGDVTITDGLRIDGRLQGNVLCKDAARGLLVLSEKGSIAGGAKVYDAVINGSICGDLEVENFLELQANARVTGNIRYRQVHMECGAKVDGRLEHLTDRTETVPVAASNVVTLTRTPTPTASDHDLVADIRLGDS